MTLIEYVNRAGARLDEAGVSFGHGTTNAFDEAAWLVLWKLGLPLDDLDGVADRVLDAEEHCEHRQHKAGGERNEKYNWQRLHLRLSAPIQVSAIRIPGIS